MIVALALALLHFVWQGLVLGLLALGLRRALGSSAAARYVGLFALLVAAPIAFAATFVGIVANASPAGPTVPGPAPVWADLIVAVWILTPIRHSREA